MDTNKRFFYTCEVYRKMVCDSYFEKFFAEEMPFTYKCFLSGMPEQMIDNESLKRAYSLLLDYEEYVSHGEMTPKERKNKII